MNKPRSIILSGYGLNCEEETAHAFRLAGAEADIVHINDLITDKKKLKKYQILAVPGGFSYGDDTGSGKAYANKLRNHLKEALDEFAQKDKLIAGICNGFQIITNLGLLPGALTFNDNARYTVRWVDLKTKTDTASPWLKGIKKLSLPIAHGEGKYIADKKALRKLEAKDAVAFKYEKGEVCRYQSLPTNPNGSVKDIAGVTSHNGRVLGMMPHPERAIFFTQLPHWTFLKEKLCREGKPIPKEGPGMQLFKNAVEYFKY